MVRSLGKMGNHRGMKVVYTTPKERDQTAGLDSGEQMRWRQTHGSWESRNEKQRQHTDLSRR